MNDGLSPRRYEEHEERQILKYVSHAKTPSRKEKKNTLEVKVRKAKDKNVLG